MKKDIVLSIMVSSAMMTGVIAIAHADTAAPAKKVDSKAPTSSGKCASGKCGTEKIYDKINLKEDPQDKLVWARDGKCGITGKGINSKETPEEIKNNKSINGLCGK